MDVPSFFRGRGAGFCMTMAGAVGIFGNIVAWLGLFLRGIVLNAKGYFNHDEWRC